MKKIILLIAVSMAACCSLPAGAQEINVSLQPTWGPTGYDYVNYYYIPDIDAYYCVPTGLYTYYDGYRWTNSPYLPPRYSHFDLYNAHKVVLNEPTPWHHNDLYRSRYSHFRGMHDQSLIRESHDHRYFEGRHMGEHRMGEEHRGEEHRMGEEHRGEEHHHMGEEHHVEEHHEGGHRMGEGHHVEEHHGAEHGNGGNRPAQGRNNSEKGR